MTPARSVPADNLLQRLERLPQTVRFLLAGGMAAGICWCVRILLSVAMPFLPAVLLAQAIGMSVGFVVYRRFVFPPSSRSTLHQLRDFLGVNLLTALAVAAIALALNALLAAMIAPAVVAEALAHGLAIGAGAVLNYLGHALVTFASPARRALAVPEKA